RRHPTSTLFPYTTLFRSREDHLAVRGRVDVRTHLLPRALVAGGRAFGERVDATMDVRVGVLVELAHRVEHLPRLLRRGGRVEVRSEEHTSELQSRFDLVC